jgi:hypothetical protein
MTQNAITIFFAILLKYDYDYRFTGIHRELPTL